MCLFTLTTHDDVIKWKHFPRYCPFVRGIHRSRRIPRTKASDAELWCFLWSAWINDWVNNREAGDLRRHRGHHVVNVMRCVKCVTINSLATGRFEWSVRYVICELISVIDDWGVSCTIDPMWLSLEFNDDKSTLLQVMAWFRQAPSHYLSQCWQRSMPP